MGRRALELGEHGEITATPQRRDPGSGRWVKSDTVRQAERWRARTYVRGNDGVRREISGYGRRKPDAVASVQEQLDALDGGDSRLAAATPLATAGEIWLDLLRRPSARPKSPRTLELYESALNRYVLGEGSPVRGLNLRQVNDVPRIRGLLQHVADKHGTGAAKVTRTVVSGILQAAIVDGGLDFNAARSVEPARASVERETVADHDRAFTRQELDQVLRYADVRAELVEPTDDEPEPTVGNARTIRQRVAVADLIAFLAGTGVRIDEARSLLWADVDLGAATAEIRGTKTKTSHRLLSLPGWLVERLRRREHDYGTDGYVFASPALTTTTTKWEKRNSHRAVRTVLDGAGFPWATSHSFRRTVASELHRLGAPLVRISDQLGHAHPTMTADRYLGRSLRGDKADLAALL